MRKFETLALTTWLAAAGLAAAQVPRDPLAEAAPARQAPPQFVTRQSEVEIPFTVKTGASAENQPTSVRVFVSWDRGQTWHFYDERKPEDARFRFKARQDGEFWFATQTIDRSGRSDNGEAKRPQLRLVIDTQRPQLLVQTNVNTRGEVSLSWSAADANLSAGSFKLEYQDAAGTGGAWQAIDATSPNAPSPNATPTLHSGQTSFLPMVSGKVINLRAEIADAAGNVGYYSQRLSLIPPKPKAANGLASDPSATRWPTDNAAGNSSSGTQLAADATSGSSDNEAVQIPGVVSNPFVGPGRLASSQSEPNSLPPPAAAVPGASPNAATSGRGLHDADTWQSGQPLPNTPATPPGIATEGRSSRRLTTTSADPSSEGTLPPQSSVVDVPPSTVSPAETMPSPRPAESVEAPTAQRPRLTNSRRFSLDYDIQTVGPEGVSAVELWGTTDQGRAWTKWGSDPDKASPFDVEVNHEAVYGFRIVVVGKNGLATSTPQSGDAADIWVGVDLTRPTAKLTGAVYGQGEAAGKLDIRWQANDANLGSRPITLSISDRPDSRFTTVAAGLPNTGQYFWEYDPRSPRQIYLRLEVRDDAGNITIDQLSEPIKVEGLEPKGQIRGFSPGPETPRGADRGAFRSPLFR